MKLLEKSRGRLRLRSRSTPLYSWYDTEFFHGRQDRLFLMIPSTPKHVGVRDLEQCTPRNKIFQQFSFTSVRIMFSARHFLINNFRTGPGLLEELLWFSCWGKFSVNRKAQQSSIFLLPRVRVFRAHFALFRIFSDSKPFREFWSFWSFLLPFRGIYFLRNLLERSANSILGGVFKTMAKHERIQGGSMNSSKV